MLHCIFLFIFIIFNNIASFQPKTFKYYSYKDIMTTFTSLAKSCPNYIKIDTSQSRYNLDHVPGCNGANCENLIVYLTDFDTYTLSRPHYYISGLVHGNEEIGPTSLVEFAMYFCNKKNTTNVSSYDKSFHILKSKLFIFTPMTNAYGYANEQREDRVVMKNTSQMKLIDPNRDFPYFDYNYSNVSNECMQTLTSRTVNEIFNEHIIQAAITFHGGINVLGYAWGNFIHAVKNGHQYKSTESPDHNAFYHIGMAMKDASSSKTNEMNTINDYVLGDMSALVYPVDGGMEDWAYAGSWENEVNKDIRPIKQCEPNTFSEYHMEWESNKDNWDYKLRCLMYLAETSFVKKPNENTLGNDNKVNDVFDFETYNDFYGHVIRNMRLIYAGADMIFASVYIEMSKIIMKNNDDDNEMILPFTLMGCHSVKNISLFSVNYYALSKEMLTETFFNKATLTLVNSLPNNNNNTSSLQCYWSNYSQTYSFSIPTHKHLSTNNTFDADFKGTIYFIRGEAPDETWSTQEHPDPNVLPQSHVVRSKSNISYYVSNGNYTVKSNYYFYSYPIVISDKYPPLIVDDIDSLFYPIQHDLTFIPLEYTTLPNDYIIHYNTLLTLTSNISKPTLTSTIEYDVNLYMTLYHKDSSQNEKYSNKISEYVAQAHLALSNVTEKFNFYDITCTVEEYTTNDYLYKQIIIKCKSILSQIQTFLPSNGYFIRNYLSNSFVSFSTVASAQTLPIKIVGVFSIDNTSSGRFYPSIKRLTLSCGSFIQSSLIPQIQSSLSYNMTISKASNTNVNVTFHAKDMNYTYLLIFPFAKDTFIVNSTYNSTFQLNISENVNSKLIGKTVYVYKLIDNHSVELVRNLTKGKHNSLSFVKDIINVLDSNRNSVICGKCTVLSNALYIVYNNKEILAKIVNASEFNYTETNANHVFNMVIKYVVISIVTIFILGFITRNMIKRLCSGCCVKGYDRLQTKREIEIMSFKI